MISDKNKLKRNYSIVFLTMLFSIFAHVSIQEPFFVAKLLVGLFGFIFLPGYVFATLVFKGEKTNIAVSFVLGFLLQLVNIFVLWTIHIVFNPINFSLMIYLFTTIEMIFLLLFCYKGSITVCFSRLKKELRVDPVLVAIVVVYIILALFWQQWALAPSSDGGSYLDLARNVVEKGSFSSNMLIPASSWYHVMYSSGMQIHMFGYFAIAIFFMLGNVSLFSAQMMLVFSGLLLIVVSYELTAKLFSVNIARIAALIAALSPELLSHAGLVGGPEVPSALFTLFAIYILISTRASKRTLFLSLLAGMSLFVAWYAWEFNFYVMLTFLPLLFIYIALTNKELKAVDVFLFLLLLASFVLEHRILLNYSWLTIGFPFPSIFLLVFLSLYFLRLRKSSNKATLIMFVLVILTMYFLLYTRVVAGVLIPQVQQFAFTTQSEAGLIASTINRDVSLFSKAFNLYEVGIYWNMYWDGILAYVGAIIVFLAIISIAKIDKFKEVTLLLSFPILQAIWWSLFVTIDNFQPRYIVSSSIFYFMLTAATMDMIVSNGVVKIGNIDKLNLKLKISNSIFRVRITKMVASLILVFLITSVVVFTYPLYDRQQQILKSWNYPKNLGWEDGIRWINENTSKDDVLASMYANYFTWCTNRKTVSLSSTYYPDSLNLTDLVTIIRTFEARYLIVEQSFYTYFKNLQGLYSQSMPFLGATVEFNSTDPSGKRLTIYNVTNIAFGNLTKYYTVIDDVSSIEYWVPNLYYGNGTISLDVSEKVEGNTSIAVQFSVIERPLPQAAIVYAPQSPLNLTSFTRIDLWIKVPKCQDVALTLLTDTNNYATYVVENVPNGEWYKFSIQIAFPQISSGKIDLSNISSIRLYVRGLQVNLAYDFWIDDVVIYRESYVLS